MQSERCCVLVFDSTLSNLLQRALVSAISLFSSIDRIAFNVIHFKGISYDIDRKILRRKVHQHSILKPFFQILLDWFSIGRVVHVCMCDECGKKYIKRAFDALVHMKWCILNRFFTFTLGKHHHTFTIQSFHFHRLYQIDSWEAFHFPIANGKIERKKSIHILIFTSLTSRFQSECRCRCRCRYMFFAVCIRLFFLECV